MKKVTTIYILGKWGAKLLFLIELMNYMHLWAEVITGTLIERKHL